MVYFLHFYLILLYFYMFPQKLYLFFTEFYKVYECYFKFSKKPQSYFVLRKFCVTVKLNILKK